MERPILKLPLSKLCAVPLCLQNRVLFKGEKRAKRCREKGMKRVVASKGGEKEKRTCENRSANHSSFFDLVVTFFSRPLPASPFGFRRFEASWGSQRVAGGRHLENVGVQRGPCAPCQRTRMKQVRFGKLTFLQQNGFWVQKMSY